MDQITAKQGKQNDAVVKRIARKQEDEEHGGAWKVAFADFCLALMCLFLVLWVMAARDSEELAAWARSLEGSVLDEGVGRLMEAFTGPRGSMLAREPLPKGEPGAKDPEQKLLVTKKRLESPEDLLELAEMMVRLSEQVGLAGNLQTVLMPYGLRVMLHDTDKQGMFERGSAMPTDRFGQLLRRIGVVFAQIENQMLVIGHTDSVQYVNQDEMIFSNWTLSSQRAVSARAQLLNGGMPRGRVLQVVGMADQAPLDEENTRAALNRRVELLILTSRQARAIAEMFGMPKASEQVIEGVRAVVPDASTLSRLKEQLRNAGK